MNSKQILLLWQHVQGCFKSGLKFSSCSNGTDQNRHRVKPVFPLMVNRLCHCGGVHSSSQVTSSQCCCGIRCRTTPPSPHTHLSCQYKHYSPSMRTHQISYIFIIYPKGKWFTVEKENSSFRASTTQTLRPLQR